MFEHFEYAYLVGNLFFAFIWIALFVSRKDLRRKILIMSSVVAPLALTQLFFVRDYWRPEYFHGSGVVGVEDFVFSFLIGGIGGGIYEEIFGKKYVSRHLERHPHWMFIVAVVGMLWMIIGNIILQLNSMSVTIAGLLLIGATILISRHDLVKDAIFSGLLTGSLMVGFYILWTNLFPGVVQQWWLLNNLSGIIILGAPLEEIMFGFGWGFLAGPTYEFIHGLKFRK